MGDLQSASKPQHAHCDEQGFLLVGVIVLVALVLIALSVAAPVVAKDLKREKELEAMHRGQQYTRAIRLYYKKFNGYPSSVKLLEGGAPKERFLREHYLDPMTGKDDWKLIAVGQAKTTVKGFFGQPLAGLNGAAGGLGSASGLQSGGQGIGSTGGTVTPPGAFDGSTPGAGSGGVSGATPGGQSSNPGGPGSGSSTFGSSSFGQSGASGSSNSPFESGSTGPFVGVGIPKEGAAIITFNEQSDYAKWEFIYDPRIEQFYSKSSIFGGGIATSSGGLGSASGSSSTPGAGSGTGANGPTSGSPSLGGSPGATSPTTPAPQ